MDNMTPTTPTTAEDLAMQFLKDNVKVEWIITGDVAKALVEAMIEFAKSYQPLKYEGVEEAAPQPLDSAEVEKVKVVNKTIESIKRNLSKLNNHTWSVYKEQIEAHIENLEIEVAALSHPLPAPVEESRMSLQEHGSNYNLVSKLKECVKNHMAPYNLGDMGKTTELILEMCDMLLASQSRPSAGMRWVDMPELPKKEDYYIVEATGDHVYRLKFDVQLWKHYGVKRWLDESPLPVLEREVKYSRKQMIKAMEYGQWFYMHTKGSLTEDDKTDYMDKIRP